MKRLFYLLPLAISLANNVNAQTPAPNIVFIICDDMNTYMEGYETQPQVLTPNLYELGQQGTVFLNAHAPSPKCAPSRTSILTGKDPEYTQVFDNTTYNCVFRDNFDPDWGNEEVFTLPEYLKDSMGYYTYSIGKVMHCYEAWTDVDTAVADPCARGLSWNQAFIGVQDPVVDSIGEIENSGFNNMQFAAVSDTLMPYMEDHKNVDAAISFIQDFAAFGTDVTCGKPFFMGLGIKNPHTPIYIPETFFPSDFLPSIWDEPFNYPYNIPENAYPTNGVVMPPQPEPDWVDYDSLGYMGQLFAVPQTHNQILHYTDELPYYPVIDAGLTDEERVAILQESLRANTVIAYMAAVQYLDYEIGRFLDELATHPEIYNNTIIIMTSDHGFSLGQKKHWGKMALWETDMRVPFIIADLRNPLQQECTKPVSTLDVFPTVLDMLDAPSPTFADGSDYLDGFSLAPLVTNGNMEWSKPSIGIVRQKAAGGKVMDGSCFSQFSVRDERFHLIQYHTNNHPPTLSCNEGNSETEMELYDIGAMRETDPFEWNNLIDDPDYTPVVEYLEAFLPGAELYQQLPQTIKIVTPTAPPCLLKNNAKLKLRGDVYDVNGVLLGGAAVGSYTFTWTNNLTAAVYTGRNYTFNFTTIPAATFAANDEILFYLRVTETATGNLVGFSTKTFYIGTTNKPVINFNLETDTVLLTATVIDYTLTGTYINSVWDFGDGTILDEALPATHTYAMPGLYAVKNTVTYGNVGCTVSKTKPAHLELRTGNYLPGFSIFPNPATQLLHISPEEQMGETTIEIINMLGEVVVIKQVGDFDATVTIDIALIASGEYMVRVRSNETSWNEMIIIQH